MKNKTSVINRLKLKAYPLVSRYWIHATLVEGKLKNTNEIFCCLFVENNNVAKLLRKVMPTIGHGISIILFKNKGDKEHFQTLLNSSPTVAPLIVKMEADSLSLLFQTADELEKMLIEFKSM